MPSEESRAKVNAVETRAEEALGEAERSLARQAGSARWLVGRLGLWLVALGAQLVRLGLPPYQAVNK